MKITNDLKELKELKEVVNYLLLNDYNFNLDVNDVISKIEVHGIMIISFKWDFDKNLYIKIKASRIK